jgi:hypothetical protein
MITLSLPQRKLDTTKVGCPLHTRVNVRTPIFLQTRPTGYIQDDRRFFQSNISIVRDVSIEPKCTQPYCNRSVYLASSRCSTKNTNCTLLQDLKQFTVHGPRSTRFARFTSRKFELQISLWGFMFFMFPSLQISQ